MGEGILDHCEMVVVIRKREKTLVFVTGFWITVRLLSCDEKERKRWYS